LVGPFGQTIGYEECSSVIYRKLIVFPHCRREKPLEGGGFSIVYFEFDAALLSS